MIPPIADAASTITALAALIAAIGSAISAVLGSRTKRHVEDVGTKVENGLNGPAPTGAAETAGGEHGA